MTTGAVAPPPRRNRAAPEEAPVVRHRPARWLIAIAVVVVLLVVAFGVSRSPLFSVDTVVVKGAPTTQEQQVREAAGIAEGDALPWVSTGDAEDRLEAVPEVRTAKVTKEWPHTVRIVVTTRTAVAWTEGPSGKVLVDGTGRVLEQVEAPPPGLPQLLGLATVPPPGGTVSPTGPALVAGVLPALAAAGTTSVTAAARPGRAAPGESGAPAGMTMQLANGTEVRLGDASRLRAKIAAAVAVLGAMADQPVHYVDVSVPTNPVAG